MNNQIEKIKFVILYMVFLAFSILYFAFSISYFLLFRGLTLAAKLYYAIVNRLKGILKKVVE